MLMAADALLAAQPAADDAAIHDGIGGVLCRCTGYAKIVEAIAATRDARQRRRRRSRPPTPRPGPRSAAADRRRSTGCRGSLGTARFGADERPDGVARRSAPSVAARAREIRRSATSAPFRARHPGLVDVLTARDVPGQNRYGIYATGKDQPALADGVVRHRGEAVARARRR